MKVLCDAQIEHVADYFGCHAEVRSLAGREISQAHLLDADIVLTRSITKIDAALLADTPVKFVGSATAGADHIDMDYLAQQQIGWAIAPGCNAPAVSDYVLSVLACLQQLGHLAIQSVTVGVIGAGHVGRLVAAKLTMCGFKVLLFDPPRAMHEASFVSAPIEALSACDVVCLHVPLTRSGQHPTYHMVDKVFLSRLRPGCVLLNAARGDVVDESALLRYGNHLIWCMDVWASEPHVALAALAKCVIATPHIAGHSLESKRRGLEMIYSSACNFFGWTPKRSLQLLSLPSLPDRLLDWQSAFIKNYNPLHDSAKMKAVLPAAQSVATAFDALRRVAGQRHDMFVD